MTISPVGVAWFREGGNQQNLYARADGALYRKPSGRKGATA